MVFGNETLIQMAARRPTSADELLGISGVGLTKLGSFGTLFLAEIGKHA